MQPKTEFQWKSSSAITYSIHDTIYITIVLEETCKKFNMYKIQISNLTWLKVKDEQMKENMTFIYVKQECQNMYEGGITLMT
jgi:hypothetical protein